MSYDIEFRVKVDTNGEKELFFDTRACDANITWNVRDIITESTGLKWENEADNGLVLDIIPAIEAGLAELMINKEYYRQYEDPNGYGTVEGVQRFFRKIISDWHEYCKWNEEYVKYTHFFIC